MIREEIASSGDGEASRASSEARSNVCRDESEREKEGDEAADETTDRSATGATGVVVEDDEVVAIRQGERR